MFKIIIFIIAFFFKIESTLALTSFLNVDNIELKNTKNLSSNQILEKTYLESFNKLISRIVLSEYYNKVKSEASEAAIKDMIFSYKAVYSNEETVLSYPDDILTVNYKFEKNKIYNFLKQINVPYSNASKINISILVFVKPVPYINHCKNICSSSMLFAIGLF